MFNDDKRNPLIIPKDKPAPKTRGCPKCGHDDFVGRNIQGTVTWTCKSPECGNKWTGGFPNAPADPNGPTPLIDPTRPIIPVNPADRPPVAFVKDAKGNVVERRQPTSTVPHFRKGVPIPSGEE